MIGKHFGAYKIESKIGEGGMGVVYRATDTELDRPVAIKMVLDSVTQEGPEGTEAVARFLREAKAASRLQHPSIVHIYQFGVQDNSRYMVMEFIEGKNLKAVIGGRPMTVERICEITAQVADGLAVAHEMGVIHRDLKVENIMITPRGQAKILDFGLAKIAEAAVHSAETTDDVYKTQLGTVLGTVSSMAPEQALGRDVDAKADIFSLGVVMYEMATGKNPFLAPTAQNTLARVMNHNPELVSLVNPGIPPELERLVHLCLRKDPKQRPSAQEVTNTCKRLLATMSNWAAAGAEGGCSPYDSHNFPPGVAPAPTPTPKPGSVAKPPSGSRVNAPQQAPAAADSAVIARLTWTHFAVKSVRWLLQLATLTVPLSFFVYMLVGAGVVRADFVERSFVWPFVKAMVVPVLTFSDKLFTFRAIVNGWNLMLVVWGLIAFVVRHFVIIPAEKLEYRAKTKIARAKSGIAGPQTFQASDKALNDRLTLLREYSEGQRLASSGNRLAFLALEVVGWARMQQGEDALMVEHAHAEFKKFMDRIFRRRNAWKTSFTAEGAWAVFRRADDAVGAAQDVLRELAWFNDGVHRLQSEFHVRCGINSGDMTFPEDKAIEDIENDVVTLAAHMRKNAQPDAVWLSGEALAEVSNSGGFEMVTTQKVDGRSTYQWHVSASTNPEFDADSKAVGAS